jgi:cytochrome c oxidase subunit 2
LKADAEYIRESIRQPKAKVHKGYQPVMPDFGPQIKDREIDTITEFLKSISPEPANRQDAGPIAAPK